MREQEYPKTPDQTTNTSFVPSAILFNRRNAHRKTLNKPPPWQYEPSGQGMDILKLSEEKEPSLNKFNGAFVTAARRHILDLE